MEIQQKLTAGIRAETGVRDSDDGGVALQKSVLLNGAVEAVLGIGGAIGLVKGRRMVAEHAIGHGHFGG